MGLVPAQEDKAGWGHREVDKWLQSGASVRKKRAYDFLRSSDMRAQVWRHLSPLTVCPAKLGQYRGTK